MTPRAVGSALVSASSTWAWLPAVLLVVACGGTAAPTRGPVVPEGDQKTRRDAVKQARGVIEEIYESMRRGDVDGLSAIVAPDVIVIGPGPGVGYRERADALVALGEALRSGKHQVDSQELKVVSSPAGGAAWATDRLDVDGQRMHVVVLLTGADDLWSVTLVHLAPPISAKQADRAAGAAIDPPRGGVITPSAAEAARQFTALTSAPELVLEQLGEGEDAVLVPGTNRSITVGRKAIRKLWKKVMKEAPTWTPRGTPAAGLGADGSLAWVWGHVDVSIDGPALTHRVFALYQQSGGVWDLVVLHPAVLLAK